MSRQWSEQEMASAVDYVSGEMTEEARLRFELNLCENPELAETVQGLLDADELLWRERPNLGAEAPVARAWPWRSLSFVLAAAVLLAVLVLPRMLEGDGPVQVRIALMEGDNTADSYVRRRSLDASAPDFDRGFESLPAGFAEAQAAAHERELREAFEAGRTELRSALFRIPIEVDRDCSVVVLGFSESGGGRRLFPREDDRADSARLPAGTHTLPRPPFRRLGQAADSTTLVDFDRGFVVYRSERALEVLVALRTTPLTEEDLRLVDSLIETPRAEWDSQLAAGSFELVATMNVSEGS